VKSGHFAIAAECERAVHDLLSAFGMPRIKNSQEHVHREVGAVKLGADFDERAFVELLRQGDDSAFETLVQRYGGRMLSVARRFLPAEQDARDAVQEALLSAFRSIRSFAGEARLSTWLHRIVVNAALMQLRSRRRRNEEPIENLLPHFNGEGQWADETSGAFGTDMPYERRDTRELVRNCIARLPQNYRTVLMLRDIEDLDTEQVAAMLEVTTNSIKVRLHRARQALRTIIEHEMDSSRAATSQVRI
jgi:RNA polymerase sigma-70 factor, ECF subfamily